MWDYRHPVAGFTLIELIVVISLISVMLMFTIPRVRSSILTDPSRKTSRWLMMQVQSLREAAVREQKTYTLNVQFDTGKFWITGGSMEDEERSKAEQRTFIMPGGYRVIDVEFPGSRKIALGEAQINFYKSGYSDKAMIHVENEDNERMSFLIEPFLSKVRQYNGYVGFNG